LRLEWGRLNGLGQYEEAIRVAGRLESAAGEDEQWRQGAQIWKRTSELNLARLRAAEGERVRLVAEGEAAQGWFTQGEAALELDLPKLAAACFEDALALDANLASAWTGLGVARAELDPPLPLEEVLECFDRAIALSPESEAAWLYRGLTLSYLHRDPEALECFERVTQQLNPDNHWAWYACGLMRDASRDHEAALRCYAEGLRHDSDSDSAWSCHGARMAMDA
jgi:tetratricopeptide (TPR) repeat protein